MTNIALTDTKLAFIGLGYVGLTLAAAFGRKRRIIGLDIRQQRISKLQSGHIRTIYDLKHILSPEVADLRL